MERKNDDFDGSRGTQGDLSSLNDEAKQRRSEEEEHAALVNDIINGSVYGQLQPLPQATVMARPSSPMLDLGIRHMQGALALLPDERQQAYREALQKSPQVVELDTSLERYLVAFQFNYFQAAEKICDYWTERKDIFGNDRFAWPLRMEGPHTALSPDARAVMQSGVFFVTTPDANGRIAILYDRQMVPLQIQNLNVRRQAAFYIMHVAAVLQESQPQSQPRSFVGITVGESSPNRNCRSLSPSMTVMKLVLSDFCGGGRISRLYCIIPQQQPHQSQQPEDQTQLPAPTAPFHNQHSETTSTTTPRTTTDGSILSASYSSSAIFEHFLNQWCQWRSFQVRMCFFRVKSTQDCLRQIEPHGLSLQHVPRRLGGTANFASWRERQLVWEHQRYSGIFFSDDGCNNPKKKAESAATGKASAQAKVFNADESTGEEDARNLIQKALALMFEQWQTKKRDEGGVETAMKPRKEAKKRQAQDKDHEDHQAEQAERKAGRRERKKQLKRL
mmetsp:Transcript_29694/g.81600  ORF Transcript_29694/g.81600 Transcript_29694/m.81600 type:complete len:503 (-) Transcript_29694:1283-2791(-)